MTKWLSLLLLVSLSASGSDAGRTQLDQFAADLDTLSGQFKQITIDASGRLVEEAGGEFYFARPDRFRWNYGEPFPQEIVADGDQLWHYDESLEQVTVRPQPDASQSPLLVLTRPELLDRFYRVTASGLGLIEFEPLDANGEIERGRLYFSNGLPDRLEIEDSFGQLTRLVLHDLQRNPELSDELFDFQVPDGVDLLEGY